MVVLYGMAENIVMFIKSTVHKTRYALLVEELR